MKYAGVASTFWTPPPDTELTWFRPGSVAPARPRPLELTLAVDAFVYGFTHALESLNFPFYEVRARLVDGELYFASVPSALAEGDLTRRMTRMRDATLRFSRNIRGPWERDIRREVESYTERMAAFPPTDTTNAEVAVALAEFKRVRANQWFAPIRAVIAPAALLQAGIGDTPLEDALAVVQEVRAAVLDQGTAAFTAAIDRVAARLAQAGCIEAAPDVIWLTYDELRQALEHGGSYHARIDERRATFQPLTAGPAPAMFGPPLPTDAPRMYLLRETLTLLTA